MDVLGYYKGRNHQLLKLFLNTESGWIAFPTLAAFNYEVHLVEILLRKGQSERWKVFW